ncbi:MAG: hypothetical protein WKF97_16140 [Chitinophagaceae bacterium]
MTSRRSLFLMKYCFLASMLISYNAVGQKAYDWRSNIDFIVAKSDSLSNKSQRTFHLNKYLKNDKVIKETWHYTLNEGKVVIFQLRYIINLTEFLEVYYLHKERLICMEIYESEDNTLSDDRVKRGAVFFFVGNTLKQYVTMGHANLKAPAIECLSRFDDRFSELQKNIMN